MSNTKASPREPEAIDLPNFDEIKKMLDNKILDWNSPRFLTTSNANTIYALLIPGIEKLLSKAQQEARLIELDLFEQFMNQHSNTGVTRGMLYEYKRTRLDALTASLQKGKL